MFIHFQSVLAYFTMDVDIYGVYGPTKVCFKCECHPRIFEVASQASKSWPENEDSGS